MTALLDPTHRSTATRSFPAATPPTTVLPGARRSAPGAVRTVAMPPAASPETTLTEVPVARRPGRSGLLLGAAVALAGVATVVGLTVHAPLAPLGPAPVVGPAASTAMCAGGSCEGLDPTTEGCQQDAHTVTSRVVTAERRGVEVPAGVVELRASVACRAMWARYTIDPTAPVGEIAVESRDGRAERTAVDVVAGHPHLGYGTTPMLTGSGDLRASVSPVPGHELPSRATAWTGTW